MRMVWLIVENKIFFVREKMFRRSLSKTNKRHFRTLLTVALSISMIFSVCGCGRNEVKVEDYGGGAATSSDETDVNSNTDPGTYKQDDRGLRDFFGKEILWNEDFTVQGKKANVYSKYIVKRTQITATDEEYEQTQIKEDIYFVLINLQIL